MSRIVLSVVLLCAVQALAAPLHRYTVTVDDTLERFSIAACFDGAAPPSLLAHDTAQLFLQSMQLRSPDAGELTINGWQAVLSEVPDDACVDYVVRLTPKSTGVQKGGPETRRVGRDLLTDIGDWLWRPAELPDGGDIEIRFELPPGIAVSAPWRRVATNAYRIGTTPPQWPGVVAFGGFEPVAIEVPGARIELILIDNPLPRLREALIRWIERAALSINSVYGTFPVDALQVIIAPTPRGDKPVPWAYVARGGGSAIHIFVRPRYPESAFMRDWSVVHEMSHLFLPYLEWGDAWIGEGLPTYYQNVAMARGGLIPPEEAWRRMYEGFDTAKDVGSQFTVYEAAERLGRRGLYRRVYWGGAAYLLAADLRLRQISDGTMTLGDALIEIRRCCLNGTYRWSAEELIERLDAVTQTSVFSELLEQQIKSRPFPDYEQLFETLGIQILGGYPIFVDGAAAVHRNAIMAPR